MTKCRIHDCYEEAVEAGSWIVAGRCEKHAAEAMWGDLIAIAVIIPFVVVLMGLGIVSGVLWAFLFSCALILAGAAWFAWMWRKGHYGNR